MPLLLKDIPDGVTCFLDATIFFYHLVHTPPLSDDCSDLLARIGTGSITGVTSAVALAEATHKVMLAEITKRSNVTHQGLIARIKKHPEWLDNLAEHKQVMKLARALRVGIESITEDTLRRGADLSSQQRLLTNDALTLAIIEELDLNYLATNDDDFDSIPNLTVCKPRRS